MHMAKHLVFVSGFAALLFVGTATANEDTLQIAKLESASEIQEPPLTNVLEALDPTALKLRSASAFIVDQEGNIVYAKQAHETRPIASITKLMTAMVILDAELPMDERLTITRKDRDRIRFSRSRLRYGATLTREELLRLMLMASENRAASALARTYPGGLTAFVEAMNYKAQALGMRHSRFAGPSGLHAGNVASARDIVAMVRAAYTYPFIREASTARRMSVQPYSGRRALRFGNTNRLLRSGDWNIELSKTGYINEAGRCLVMRVNIADEPLVIVLLNSFGKLTPYGDSNRIRRWIERKQKELESARRLQAQAR